MNKCIYGIRMLCIVYALKIYLCVAAPQIYKMYDDTCGRRLAKKSLHSKFTLGVLFLRFIHH